jgi:hypothetical protein
MDARKEKIRSGNTTKIPFYVEKKTPVRKDNDKHKNFLFSKNGKTAHPKEKRMQGMKIQAILTSNERNLAANVQSLQEGEAHA